MVTMPNPIVSVQNLSKRYQLSGSKNHEAVPGLRSKENHSIHISSNNFWALKDISFDLYKGDVMGLIGKNGSGKSTLLKILSGIIKPTGGQVYLNGNTTSILEVGTGFHPDLTGKENVFFNGQLMGMSQKLIIERYAEIVEFSGIGKFIENPVKNYSSGMYLRLAMSIALHSNVDVLIVDEIMSVGDAEFRMKLVERIQLLIKNGMSIILASHNVNEIMQLCDKCLVLKQGILEFIGPASEAINSYMEPMIDEIEDEKFQNNNWEWPTIESAPGNDSIRMRRVCIKSKEKREGNKIYIEDDLEIEIQFWKLKRETTIHAALLFRDIRQNPIFYASSIHKKSGAGIHELFKNETGLFSLKCELPGYLFNHNYYAMQVSFKEDSIEVYKYKEWLPFKVLKDPSVTYDNSEPDVFRPSFEWSHDKVLML